MDYFISHIYLPYSLFRLVWLVSDVHDLYVYIYVHHVCLSNHLERNLKRYTFYF